jgi:hypothetical protein
MGTNLNIKQIIEKSLASAKKKDKGNKGPVAKFIHRSRSKEFVKSLAESFSAHYLKDDGFRILSRDNNKHRLEFGLNELLYDVLVCKTKEVPSVRKKKQLRFVTEAIWQIESELKKHNSRPWLYDFNKLVLGSSENKLFIGSQGKDEKDLLQLLSEPAKHCRSNTYIALIPHPSQWEEKTFSVKCWIFENDWREL